MRTAPLRRPGFAAPGGGGACRCLWPRGSRRGSTSRRAPCSCRTSWAAPTGCARSPAVIQEVPRFRELSCWSGLAIDCSYTHLFGADPVVLAPVGGDGHLDQVQLVLRWRVLQEVFFTHLASAEDLGREVSFSSRLNFRTRGIRNSCRHNV